MISSTTKNTFLGIDETSIFLHILINILNLNHAINNELPLNHDMHLEKTFF